MTEARKHGRASDIFRTAGSHRSTGTEVHTAVDSSGNPLAAASKHSRGSLSTYQKPKKKSRQLTKTKRKQNRGS